MESLVYWAPRFTLERKKTSVLESGLSFRADIDSRYEKGSHSLRSFFVPVARRHLAE